MTTFDVILEDIKKTLRKGQKQAVRFLIHQSLIKRTDLLVTLNGSELCSIVIKYFGNSGLVRFH